ncbi:MAG: bifunctional methylenetetrahydrofolate dehydrogenase/methenyltetrahydrofolate cyclohydrolase [Mycoplasma sp.]|nr:bifunctional methylenetetrahydrofolate dehydrogenase/methenyltetrahydrofolate cyclohydrolase [Candidatus Hennigella equi]
MKLLSGINARANFLKSLKRQVANLKKRNITPTLAIILNNDSYASSVYVANKQKLCKELGIKSKLFKLPASTTNKQMLALISRLNKDKKINGLFVQLPTSDKIDDDAVINAICPDKDVDCFHNQNVGKIWTASDASNLIKPCTAAGVIELLKFHRIPMEGKLVAIVNRSNIVGKPLATLFLQENATPVILHSRSKNTKEICKQADIVITAVGRAKFFDQSYFKKDAVIVDVGINRDANNKLCGDVNVESLKNFIGWLSPVPGGVGPMTVLMLINNLVILTKKQHGGK